MICVFAAGCGTMRNVSPPATSDSQPSVPVPRKFVYGGVKDDVAHLKAALVDIKQLPDSEKGVAVNVASATAHAIDIPASAVADTLTLPITIPASIDRAVADYYFANDNDEQRKHESAAASGL